MGIIESVKKHWLFGILTIGVICISSTYKVLDVLFIQAKNQELVRQEKVITELKQEILKHQELREQASIESQCYGIRIISPRQGASVGEHLRVSGTFRDTPSKIDAQLFIVTDGPQYWPQDVVQFDTLNRQWSGSVYIGGEPPQDVTVMVAIVGNAGRVLCDYYKKVGKENLWLSLEELTDDIVQCDRIQIRKIR